MPRTPILARPPPHLVPAPPRASAGMICPGSSTPLVPSFHRPPDLPRSDERATLGNPTQPVRLPEHAQSGPDPLVRVRTRGRGSAALFGLIGQGPGEGGEKLGAS